MPEIALMCLSFSYKSHIILRHSSVYSLFYITFVWSKTKNTMVDFSRFNASGDDRRDELIRAIEHAVEHLTQGELEALYYDMLTKGLIAD